MPRAWVKNSPFFDGRKYLISQTFLISLWKDLSFHIKSEMAKICKGNRKNYCKIKLHFPQPKKNWISLKLNEKSSKCNGESTFGEIWSDYVEKELGPNKKQKIAMFCTGGIRCEKASSHLLENGFEEVYHLKGGILNYLENKTPEESDGNGEWFMFDNSVAVTQG